MNHRLKAAIINITDSNAANSLFEPAAMTLSTSSKNPLLVSTELEQESTS